MATSFTIKYPSSVGTAWQFSVTLVGSDVVITGTVGNYVPTYHILGF
jgi:hypothetical protein